jgi:small subunit ribosomal protein S17
MQRSIGKAQPVARNSQNRGAHPNRFERKTRAPKRREATKGCIMSQITEKQIRKPVRKKRVGEVVSDKMQKTIVVRVSRRVQHPIYKKTITVSKKFYAHDESKQAKPGDRVLIVETRPRSRLKRWELVEILKN